MLTVPQESLSLVPSTSRNGRAHKIVLEGEFAEIIERRWVAREYRSARGPGVSKYLFHRINGMPIRDPRRSWAAACKVARLMKPKLDKKGEPVAEIINGKEQVVMVPARIFHDLRRSGVRNMLRAGVREGVAMAIPGHRTRAVFDRYNITSHTHHAEPFRCVASFIGAYCTGSLVCSRGLQSTVVAV